MGKLIEMAVKLGRGTRKSLKCGICGEHGGDPKSVVFCHGVGLNYVSCSPFRVPIARLAAAHAAIQGKAGAKKAAAPKPKAAAKAKPKAKPAKKRALARV